MAANSIAIAIALWPFVGEMTYKIVFQPMNRIAGVKPGNAVYETATEAYAQADAFMRSDEKIEIFRDGHKIGLLHLKVLAEEEAEEARE